MVFDTAQMRSANFGCPATAPDTCPNDGQGPDMINNWLGYADDACMNAFTPGQVSRMIAAFEGLRLGVPVV
jgi:hypothetical protein